MMQNQNKRWTKGTPLKKISYVDYTECIEKSANMSLMTTGLVDTRHNCHCKHYLLKKKSQILVAEGISSLHHHWTSVEERARGWKQVLEKSAFFLRLPALLQEPLCH